MVIIKLDTASPYRLSFPEKKKPLDVVDTVRTFVTYEAGLPLEAQLPHTPLLDELLRQWDEIDDMRRAGELQRARAAAALEDLDERVRQLVRHIHRIVAAISYDTPADAVQWGFTFKQTTGNILLPETRREHLVLLKGYIAEEQRRSPAERLPQPPLAEVIAVHDALRQQLRRRRAGQSQRKRAVAAVGPVIAAMHFYLQSAVSHLLTFQFEGALTPKLQNWGYEVKLVAPKRRATPAEPPAAA